MVDADGVVEMAEDEYLRVLASQLGLEYSECSDLVLDLDVDELRASFEQLRSPPPPMVDPNTRSSRPPPPPMVEMEPPRVPSGSLPDPSED